MWIKWKYNDHGHPDFKEVEIPDDFDGYESVEEYICEMGWVPTWSERFMTERIKWERLTLPADEVKRRKIASLTASINYHKKQTERFEAELEKLK